MQDSWAFFIDKNGKFEVQTVLMSISLFHLFAYQHSVITLERLDCHLVDLRQSTIRLVLKSLWERMWNVGEMSPSIQLIGFIYFPPTKLLSHDFVIMMMALTSGSLNVFSSCQHIFHQKLKHEPKNNNHQHRRRKENNFTWTSEKQNILRVKACKKNP